MPPGLDSLVGPSIFGVLIVLGYIGKLVLDWWSKRGEIKQHNAEVIANGEGWLIQQLRGALTEEREEVQRLSGRIEELETQNALLYERMRDQRREYEKEIDGLREQLMHLTERLDALQQRLSTDPPV